MSLSATCYWSSFVGAEQEAFTAYLCRRKREVFEALGKERYLRRPKRGTNPRGVEISPVGVQGLLKHPLTKALPIEWQRPTDLAAKELAVSPIHAMASILAVRLRKGGEQMARRGSRTSSFGSPARIAHDSTPFYSRRLYEGLPKEEPVAYLRDTPATRVRQPNFLQEFRADGRVARLLRPFDGHLATLQCGQRIR
jgi:hypothetical protein